MLRRPRSGRTTACALAVALVVAALALVLGAAAPASAHATLVSTDPAEGAVLATAPEQIRLTFSEAVAGVPDGVQVFDAGGDPVGSSAATSGTDLEVTLDDEVGDGTLVVVWRVVSEDGHPISGSLSFSVGAPSAEVAAPPAADTATAPPWELSPLRWAGYLALFLGAGLVAFAVLFLPASHEADRARRRVVLGARVGAAVAASAWLAALPVTAVYQVGGGAGALTRGSTWAALAPVEYAVTAAVVLGVPLAVVLLGAGRPARRRGQAALVAGLVAVVAPALTGHTRAATPEVLAVGADMLHLVAGSLWLGGLVGLALVLPDLAGRGVAAGEVLTRFSGVAAGVLAALVATGTLLAWRIVGSWSVLVEETYGRLLLVKITAVLVACLLAAWNRFRLLPRLRAAVRRRDRRAGAGLVTRAVAAEATVLVAVVLLTGLLVDKSPEPPPPVAVAASTQAVVRASTLGPIEVRATLATQAVGANTVTVELLDARGEPTEGFEPPRVRLSSDRVDLGAVPVRNLGPGRYAGAVVLPTAGTWRLQVSLRTSEFDNPVTALDFEVS